jgi:TolA-binding protein
VAAATLPATAPSPATPSVAPSPTPPPVASDPAKDLEAVLTIPDLDSKPTARARILYAKSELARIQRKPEIEKQILLDIAKEFKPEDLSPILLGQVGDCLVQNGQPDQAVPFYNQLMDVYDQSPVVDYAYNGLAQITFAQKDYKKADRYFSKALDKGLAASKLKEITLGEAQTLLALNRPADAKPLFEQVASNRAWRGEATALSVFSLGEIQMDQGKFAEANAFYQRVFVAYQKYPAIQAKAYLKSGEAFEKLGKVPEAINTYNEMLKNPNLSPFPESSDAKQRLDHLTQK